MENLQMETIEIPNILKIFGDTQPFALELAHNLLAETISFPDLQDLQGGLLLYDSPALRNLSFAQLSSIEGDTIIAGASKQRDGSAASSAIASNGNATSASVDMGSLKQVAGNLSLSNIADLRADSLTQVKGDLNLVETVISSLSIPSLEEVNTLVLTSNKDLTTLSMLALRQLSGNLYFADNSKWIGIRPQDFPSLENIAGSLVINQSQPSTGFQSLDFGDRLQSIDGSFFLRMQMQDPSKKDFTCAQLEEALKDSGIVKGSFSCQLQDAEGNSVDASENDASKLGLDLVYIFVLALMALVW